MKHTQYTHLSPETIEMIKKISIVLICCAILGGIIYGLYWSINTLVKLGKKQTLTDDEKGQENKAVLTLVGIIVPIVVISIGLYSTKGDGIDDDWGQS